MQNAILASIVSVSALLAGSAAIAIRQANPPVETKQQPQQQLVDVIATMDILRADNTGQVVLDNYDFFPAPSPYSSLPLGPINPQLPNSITVVAHNVPLDVSKATYINPPWIRASKGY